MGVLDEVFGNGAAPDVPALIDSPYIREALIKAFKSHGINPETMVKDDAEAKVAAAAPAPEPAAAPAPEPPTTVVPPRPAVGVPYAPPAAMPPTPAPNSSDAPPPGAPLAPPPGLTPMSMAERLSALGRGYNQGGLVGGIGDAMGAGMDRNLAGQNMTYNVLAKMIGPERAAVAIQNPEIMKQLAPVLFGENKGPDLKEATDKDGNKYSVIWNAKTHQYEPIDFTSLAGRGGANGQPLGIASAGLPPGYTPAPGAPPPDAAAPGLVPQRPGPAASPYAIPAAPAGANASEFRKEMSKKTADEIANDREKAIGSVEFLEQSEAARALIDAKGHVIGRYAMPTEHGGQHSSVMDILTNPTEIGARMIKGVRDLRAGIGGSQDPNGLFAANNQARDELQQVFTKLAQSGLKATYGARITNVDVKQQEKTVPQLTDQDSKTAMSKLNEGENNSWRTLQRNIDSGTIDIRNVNPAVVERGVRAGKLSLDAGTAAEGMRAVNKETGTTMVVKGGKWQIAP